MIPPSIFYFVYRAKRMIHRQQIYPVKIHRYVSTRLLQRLLSRLIGLFPNEALRVGSIVCNNWENAGLATFEKSPQANLPSLFGTLPI